MDNIIPIRKILHRINIKSVNESYKVHRPYPMYRSSETSYNFENLRECVSSWDSYSDHMGININQLVSVLKRISENSDNREMNLVTEEVVNNIVPDLNSPQFLKEIIYPLSKETDDSLLKESCDRIIESINETVECDRVIKNLNTVLKRFNIKNVLEVGVLYKDDGISLKESLITLCSLVDTYNMDLSSKFCTSSELALLITESVDYNIDRNLILETIIDYYLEYYGKYDIEKFQETINHSADKDPFIDSSIVKDYIAHLYEVSESLRLNEFADYDKTILDAYNSPFALSMNDIPNSNSSAVNCLYELAIVDRIKENIEKMKLAPVKSISMLKEVLRSLFVTNRLQDIKAGTKNGLSLCFYMFITMGAFVLGGYLASAFAIISSAAISHHSDKLYVKNALQEWREHRYAVKRKLDECTDSEKKRKLSVYLNELDENIKLLEKEYERQRDSSLSELNQKIDSKIATKGISSTTSADYNPMGKPVDHEEEKKNIEQFKSYQQKDNKPDSDLDKEIDKYLKED